jgi:hypothetical protein
MAFEHRAHHPGPHEQYHRHDIPQFWQIPERNLPDIHIDTLNKTDGYIHISLGQDNATTSVSEYLVNEEGLAYLSRKITHRSAEIFTYNTFEQTHFGVHLTVPRKTNTMEKIVIAYSGRESQGKPLPEDEYGGAVYNATTGYLESVTAGRFFRENYGRHNAVRVNRTFGVNGKPNGVTTEIISKPSDGEYRYKQHDDSVNKVVNLLIQDVDSKEIKGIKMRSRINEKVLYNIAFDHRPIKVGYWSRIKHIFQDELSFFQTGYIIDKYPGMLQNADMLITSTRCAISAEQQKPEVDIVRLISYKSVADTAHAQKQDPDRLIQPPFKQSGEMKIH